MFNNLPVATRQRTGGNEFGHKPFDHLVEREFGEVTRPNQLVIRSATEVPERGGASDLPAIDHPELDQRLGDVARVADGIGPQCREALACAVERSGSIPERRTVTGNDPGWRERRDALQQLFLLVESGFALDLRKDRAEAMLPERVGGDQDAVGSAPEHDLVGIVAARGDDFPGETAQRDFAARLQHVIEREARAVLPDARIAESAVVPCRDGGGLARRDRDRRPEALLQVGVAAAVVRVQMRVDDACQPSSADQALDQRLGQLGVRDVAGIDDARLVGRVDEHDIVRRQPAALEHVQCRRQARKGCAVHAGYGARCAAAMARNASRSSAVPA